MMNAVGIQDCARRLYEAHGDKAEFEAAQRAKQHLKKGQKEDAQDWQRVRKAIAIMRGPHVS